MDKVFKCIKDNNIKDLRKLLDNKYIRDNLNKYFDSDDKTALMYASQGHNKCVNALLQAGADPNIQNKKGNTALSNASRWGYKYCVYLLLQAGSKSINPNIRDKKGNTALIYAARYGYKGCVSLLLKAGADPNIKNDWGDTALLYATRYGYKGCVSLLLNAGANPNIKDKDGKTAFNLTEDPQTNAILKQAMIMYPRMSLLGPKFKKKSGLPTDVIREMSSYLKFSRKSRKKTKKARSHKKLYNL